MARVSGTSWRPIPVASNDPPITPIGFILHVAVSEARDLNFENRSDGIESHLYTRRDGTTLQYRDTEREADANYHGNSFFRDGKRCGFISIETQGMGPGKWEPDQIAEIKRIIRWGHERHGIPFRVCPGPFSPGIGYHVMFGAPGAWTPVAKSCPGPDRVRQFHNEIVPWLKNGAPEGVLETVNERELRKIIRQETRKGLLGNDTRSVVARPYDPKNKADIGRGVQGAWNQAYQARAIAQEIAKKVGAPVDVNEEKIAAELLEVLSPEAIAAALSDDVAAQVADEIAARLQT